MTPHLIRQIVTVGLGVGAAVALVQQCRKPSWWLGRLIARLMNVSHGHLTDWGLGHVSVEQHFTMLDVGCGGGKTIAKLAALATGGKVYGIDYAAASVAVARATNALLIASGRVDIRQGSVSQLPFPDKTFDLVTAIETHYYWPNPLSDTREILRVLKPGGRFVLIAETYKGRRFDFVYRPAMALFRATYLTVGEHRDLLAAAGYTDVLVSEERAKGWICAVGTRSR